MSDALRAAVRRILRTAYEDPRTYEWSVQGFGMMRMYFDAGTRWRLNVWDSDLAVSNVSTIHDHPWHFQSYVIHGSLHNHRYYFEKQAGVGKDYKWMHILTGVGGGPLAKAEVHTARLVKGNLECYSTGDTYKQRADEIHETRPGDGTVTLNERVRVPGESHARVFWPAHLEWVDAMPRPATAHEIHSTLSKVWRTWT
jgi:hypothetical protein